MHQQIYPCVFVCARAYVPGGVLFGVLFRSLTATPVYHLLSRQEEPVPPAWVQGRLAGPHKPPQWDPNRPDENMTV
eukprot:4271705-Pyramimonas_sp.AAC.1